MEAILTLPLLGRYFTKETNEEDASPTPLLIVDKILKFALEKYTYRSRINNHICRSWSKREAEFVALVDKVITLNGNLKLAEKISKKKKPSGGGGGVAPKASTGDKLESREEKSARLSLWQSKCIALKKVPPTPGGPLTRTFTKKENPGLGTKPKPFHWCKHHLIWCVHTYNQCKAVNKQAADWMIHNKPTRGSITREQTMVTIVDIFGNHNESRNKEGLFGPTWKVLFWFLLTFMTSTLVDEYPFLSINSYSSLWMFPSLSLHT